MSTARRWRAKGAHAAQSPRAALGLCRVVRPQASALRLRPLAPTLCHLHAGGLRTAECARNVSTRGAPRAP